MGKLSISFKFNLDFMVCVSTKNWVIHQTFVPEFVRDGARRGASAPV